MGAQITLFIALDRHPEKPLAFVLQKGTFCPIGRAIRVICSQEIEHFAREE